MVRAFVEEIMGKNGRAADSTFPKKTLVVILLTGFLWGGASLLCASHRPTAAPQVAGQLARAHR